MESKYPHLYFRKQWTITPEIAKLLGQCEAYVESISSTPILPERYDKLMHVALLKGAQATTAIEGNTLSDEEINKMMRGEKLAPSKEYQQIEVQNLLEALNSLLAEVVKNHFDELISVDLIKRFHLLIGKNLGEHLQAIPGRLRENEVTVGSYRCPDHRDVESLLHKLTYWLTDEFHYNKGLQLFSEILIQAIVTHVYIEWIHPFSDGNGRTGRLVEFYILLRGGNPDVTSHLMSNHYNQTRPEYYRLLEKARHDRDLTSFIQYSLTGFRDGLKQTLDEIHLSQIEITWQKLIYDKFDEVRHTMKIDKFKRLRYLALESIFRKFDPKDVADLSIGLAKQYSNVIPRTVQRDIEQLQSMEILIRQGNQVTANLGLIGKMLVKKKSASNE